MKKELLLGFSLCFTFFVNGQTAVNANASDTENNSKTQKKDLILNSDELEQRIELLNQTLKLQQQLKDSLLQQQVQIAENNKTIEKQIRINKQLEENTRILQQDTNDSSKELETRTSYINDKPIRQYRRDIRSEKRVIATPDANNSGNAPRYSVSGQTVIAGNNNTIYIINGELADVGSNNDIQPLFYSDEENVKIHAERFFNNLSFGIRANTYGVGLDLATTLSSRMQLRIGADVFVFNNKSISTSTIDADLADAVGYNPDFSFTPETDFKHAHLLFDYHPWKNGPIYISTGLFVGNSKIKIDGTLVNPENESPAVLKEGNTWPDLTFAKNQIAVEDGKINAEIVSGELLKPYIGIGIGRSVPRKRISCLLEIGAIYQGDFTVQQHGNVLATDSSRADSFVKSDNYTRYLNWWPMINFQISIRLNK